METFYMVLTLSSLTASQVLFLGHPRPCKNKSACVRALPTIEGAVTRLIRYDASALEPLGTIAGGPLNRDFFVSTSACWSAQAGP